MRAGNDEAPALAGARRFEGQTHQVSGNSATEARGVDASRLEGGMRPMLHRSAAPVHRPFRTDGAGLASCAALMLGASRDLRRDAERDARRRAARGDKDAQMLLAAVSDLRRRAEAGDQQAARTIASIVSGR